MDLKARNLMATMQESKNPKKYKIVIYLDLNIYWNPIVFSGKK